MRSALLVTVAALMLNTSAPTRDSALALVGGTALLRGGTPLADAVILIRDGRITAVGAREEVRIPTGAKVVRARGKWIIPGLIDAHVHFFQSGGLYTRPDVIDLRDVRPYAEEVAWIQERLTSTFARYVASGVTGVADTGGPFWNFEVRARARRTLAAPRVAVAGPLIATYRPPELMTDDPPIIKATDAADARRLVRVQLPEHPDYIKIWFIPRPGASLADQRAIVAAAIDEAHAAGVRVMVHATQLDIARVAVNAGADLLAHSIEDRRVDDAFVRKLKERRIVYITTLMVHEGYREVLGQRVELSRIEERFGDPEVIATFDDLDLVERAMPERIDPEMIATFDDSGVVPDPSPEPTKYHDADARVMKWNLKRLSEAGITVAAGTDAGNIGTLHGPALHRELELMQQAGLSPQSVLVAATEGGARVMGRDDIGAIAVGNHADLVLLDANPLADIRNTRRIHRVMRGGRLYDPTALIETANAGLLLAP